jgi:hypothetical protein
MTALNGTAPIIAKLLRLLASDKPGEVVAAAHALRRVLHSGGLDLHDLANVVEAAARNRALYGADDVLGMVRDCHRNIGCLTTKELELIRSVADRYPNPSQIKLLRSIHERCLKQERTRGRRERASC